MNRLSSFQSVMWALHLHMSWRCWLSSCTSYDGPMRFRSSLSCRLSRYANEG